MADPADRLSADLGDQLLAVHRTLDDLGVEHAIGGAIALAFHVRRPRGTVDLDVNLAVDPDAVGPVLAGLVALAPSNEEDLRRLRETGFVRLFMAGQVPLDLFVPQHEFHADLQRRIDRVRFRSTEIPIVSATHLTVLKAMFDRPKDPSRPARVRARAARGEAARADGRAGLIRGASRGPDNLEPRAGSAPRSSQDWVDIGDMVEADSVDLRRAHAWLVELLGADHPSTERIAAIAAADVPDGT